MFLVIEILKGEIGKFRGVYDPLFLDVLYLAIMHLCDCGNLGSRITSICTSEFDFF